MLWIAACMASVVVCGWAQVHACVHTHLHPQIACTVQACWLHSRALTQGWHCRNPLFAWCFTWLCNCWVDRARQHARVSVVACPQLPPLCLGVHHQASTMSDGDGRGTVGKPLKNAIQPCPCLPQTAASRLRHTAPHMQDKGGDIPENPIVKSAGVRHGRDLLIKGFTAVPLS